MNANPLPYERRLAARHSISSKIQIRVCGKPTKMARILNLSASGVAINTVDMQLKVGAACQLVFVLDFGKIVKIHYRYATVRHVHNGVTGFFLQSLVPQ